MGGRRVVTVVVLLAAGLVAGVVVAGGPSAAYDRVRYRADETAFRAYVAEHAGRAVYHSDRPEAGADDRRWALSHPDEVLAEGRDACAWLGTQPRAPRARTGTGPYSFGAIAERYRVVSTRLDTVVSEDGQSTIVAGAWNFLCPAHLARRVARAPED